jgi:hypothetical protein
LPTPEAASAAISDTYTYYTGDGSVADGWPAESDWGSFSDLWNANVPLMQQSCGWNGWGDDDSSTEIDDINTAILQLAGSAGVDERFILAIMMQESEGCVRVPTTKTTESSTPGSCNPTTAPAPALELTRARNPRLPR